MSSLLGFHDSYYVDKSQPHIYFFTAIFFILLFIRCPIYNTLTAFMCMVVHTNKGVNISLQQPVLGATVSNPEY